MSKSDNMTDPFTWFCLHLFLSAGLSDELDWLALVTNGAVEVERHPGRNVKPAQVALKTSPVRFDLTLFFPLLADLTSCSVKTQSTTRLLLKHSDL